MGMGDFLGNMFMGDAYGSDNSGQDNNKRAMEQMWKLYTQAYNVKPIWNPKTRQYVMPSGAVQRFQMLLPLIQAQMRTGGQGKSGQQDYGALGGLAKAGLTGLYGAGLKSAGGWEGILKGIGSGVKGLWDKGSEAIGGLTAPNYSTDFGYDQQGANDFDTAFSGQPAAAPADFAPAGNTGEDWWSNAPADDMSWVDSVPVDDASFYDYTENYW